jgi:hypothetical protein
VYAILTEYLFYFVQPLYANIKEAAWPRSADDCEIEYLPDGSVRLLSGDEYASLVLSPHQQDFTVCYLSQISTEPRKPKRGLHKKKSHKPGSSSNSREQSKGIQQMTLQSDCDKAPFSQENLIPTHHDSHFGQMQESGNGSPQIDESLSKQLRNELNFSPISMASNMRSPHTSPESQEVKEQFHRYSTPTNHVPNQEEVIEIGGKKSAFRHYRQQQDKEMDGSFLGMIESPRKSKLSNIPVNHKNSHSNIGSENHSAHQGGCESSGQESQPLLNIHHSNATAQKSAELPNLPSHTPPLSQSEDSHHSSISSQSEQDSLEETSTRLLYTWVTRHFSCDECPVAWRHPLNMARLVIEQREEYEQKLCKDNQLCFFLTVV